MNRNAHILKFDVKKLKTMAELGSAQLALLQDISSGAVTNAEWRPIQKELNTLQQQWQKQSHEARTPADFKALKSIFDH